MNETIVAEILRMVQGIDQKMDEGTVRLDLHIVEETKSLDAIHSELCFLNKAFPNEDPLGHRTYHESIIERNRWITQLCKDIVRDIAKYGFLGFLVWIAYHAIVDLVAKGLRG